MLRPHRSASQADNDCCQYCCHDGGQHLPGMDNCGISAQRTDRIGHPWTMCPLLRIRWSIPGDKAASCPVTTICTYAQGRACGTPAPGLSLPRSQKGARAGREGKRELRRETPPGRWASAGKAGDWPPPGRRLGAALSRGALPSPRRRRRAAVPATARPVVTRRYAALGRRRAKAVGWPVLRAGHRLAVQDHRQGRACGASVAARRVARGNLTPGLPQNGA
jgi:hypothetical protein